MKAWLPIIPFVAALSLLGCGGSGPVADNAAAATPNVAAAEVRGMAWVAAGDGSTASFGPAGGAPALTISCDRSAAAPTLVVTRHDAAPQGGKGTLSLTGHDHVASLPMAASLPTDGPGQWEWRGSARGDMARALARPFDDPGTVEISLGGTGDLVVATAPVVRAAFDRCGA